MNYIKIKGSSKDRRDIANVVVIWFLKKNLPKFKTLDITVDIIDCYKKSKSYGYCECIDDRHREFKIEIDKKMRLFDFVTSLCHELIHLKQYARFEMKHLPTNKTQWKKTIFKDNEINYYESPWEKEAYRLEKKLAIECFEKCL